MIQIPQHGQNKKQYKTMVCRHFELGNCSIGDLCQFAHGMQELRRPNDPLPCNVPKIEANLVITNFKTVICKYHQQGFCKNSTNCCYAHGTFDKKEARMTTLKSQNQNQITADCQQYEERQLKQPDRVKSTLDHILDQLTSIMPLINSIDQQFLKQSRELNKIGQYKESIQKILEFLLLPHRSEEDRYIYESIYKNSIQFEQSI